MNDDVTALAESVIDVWLLQCRTRRRLLDWDAADDELRVAAGRVGGGHDHPVAVRVDEMGIDPSGPVEVRRRDLAHSDDDGRQLLSMVDSGGDLYRSRATPLIV